jgi:hypothetical protein
MAEKEIKKPVTDVEKPGTTPADATSRPLIVGRGPAIKDPMVNEAKSEGAEQAVSQSISPTKKKTIQPLTEQPQPEKQPEATPQPETETEEIAPDVAPSEETVKSEAAQAAQKLSEEELKRQELVNKLVVQKKYFVPIGAAKKRRTAHSITLLFIVLVLVAGGALLAVDAELLQTDITLPFDLIK